MSLDTAFVNRGQPFPMQNGVVPKSIMLHVHTLKENIGTWTPARQAAGAGCTANIVVAQQEIERWIGWVEARETVCARRTILPRVATLALPTLALNRRARSVGTL